MKKFVYNSKTKACIHTIKHELGTKDISVQCWNNVNGEWINNIFASRIINENSIEVNSTVKSKIKVIVIG